MALRYRQSWRYLTLVAVSGLALTRLALASAEDRRYEFDDVSQVVVIGDVHGAVLPLLQLLRGTGLIDADHRWVGGKTHLVSLGDLLDRGDATRPVLDLMMRLQDEAHAAGGRVHVLLGNHELMNLTGDWRDVTAADLASFSASGTGDGNTGRRQAFRAQGSYGAWLLERPLLIRINDQLFVHGGLPSMLLNGSIADANDGPLRHLSKLIRIAETLTEQGILPRETRLFDLDRKLPPRADEDSRLSELRALVASPYFGDYGPLWYRGTTGCTATIEYDLTGSVLDHFAATSVVVGHTPTWNHEVRQIMGGRVWAADTGMLHAVYGGKAGALRIERGTVTVLDPAGQPVPARAEIFKPFTAEGLEQLANSFGQNVSVRLAQQHTASAGSAAYQDDRLVEVLNNDQIAVGRGWFRKMDRRGAARELAAWRLDRLLGLGMVPDTLTAELDGASGIVTLMDSIILTEQERREQERRFPNWCERGNSYQAVAVFDALVNQRNRNANNLGYQHRLTRLRLTDHASSFGTARRLPDSRNSRAISETLRQRLNALTLETLTETLDGLISPREIRALLKRRDQIVRWPGITRQ